MSRARPDNRDSISFTALINFDHFLGLVRSIFGDFRISRPENRQISGNFRKKYPKNRLKIKKVQQSA